MFQSECLISISVFSKKGAYLSSVDRVANKLEQVRVGETRDEQLLLGAVVADPSLGLWMGGRANRWGQVETEEIRASKIRKGTTTVFRESW